ncbi:acyltransferase [Cryobacterium sp. Hz7]|uniref:acyltransferase family protein n=1 Tax=Cryobacterium sp. Hz7 TaxID=1259166 RepID=UPI00106CE618|nr:acyltransferase [Cryobacterium sp. Hz7]TFB60254.1 acyltransferase [Cryobacterium sp. Hz7]
MTHQSYRLVSLDGVRGVAAVVVLLHHAALIVPSLASVYHPGAPSTGLAGILAYTPLHLAWAGGEAVFLFFILSGLVLALPATRREIEWARYYPSRLIRLYLPVIAAIAFTVLTIVIVSRDGQSASQWLEVHPKSYTAVGIIADATLLDGVSGTVTPLWSLKWEVLFSILLPVYVAVAKRINPALVMAGSLVLLALGSTVQSGVLMYLPMFAIGVALAHGWSRISRWAEAVNGSRIGWMAWGGMLIVSATLALSTWMLNPLRLGIGALTLPLIVVGVVGLILVAAFSPLAQWILSSRPFVWLGTLSFSLYLTHEPIVVAFGYLLPTHPKLAALFAVCCAFPLAWLFHKLVEKPSHRLAQQIAGREAPVLRRDPRNETLARQPKP